MLYKVAMSIGKILSLFHCRLVTDDSAFFISEHMENIFARFAYVSRCYILGLSFFAFPGCWEPPARYSHSTEIDTSFRNSRVTFLDGKKPVFDVHPVFIYKEGLKAPYRFDSVELGLRKENGKVVRFLDVPPGQTYEVRIGRDVLAFLDPGARLTVPVGGAKDGKRWIYRIDGLGYFHVEDSVQFNIAGKLELRSGRGDFIIEAFKSGRVNILSVSSRLEVTENGHKTVITAGQSGMINDNGLIAVEGNSSFGKPEWDSGRRPFTNVSLKDIIYELTVRHRKVFIDQSGGYDIPITGVLNFGDSMQLVFNLRIVW